MRITDYFNLAVSGHKDINFIDIDDFADTKLFPDPYVIIAYDDSFCEEAKLAINSFFVKFSLHVKMEKKVELESCYLMRQNQTKLIWECV